MGTGSVPGACLQEVISELGIGTGRTTGQSEVMPFWEVAVPVTPATGSAWLTDNSHLRRQKECVCRALSV
jgi:hypothetical protein